METTEEKNEILASLFNDLRMSELKNSSSLDEFLYGKQGQGAHNNFPTACSLGKRAFPPSTPNNIVVLDILINLKGKTPIEPEKNDNDSKDVQTSDVDWIDYDKHKTSL